MQKRGLFTGLIIIMGIVAFALLLGGYLLFKNKIIKIESKEVKDNESISEEIVIDIESRGSCAVNTDCVPSSCCHATSCTTKDKAQKCEGILCTQQCAPGTLDCGQASCECIDNKCEVVYNEDQGR